MDHAFHRIDHPFIIFNFCAFVDSTVGFEDGGTKVAEFNCQQLGGKCGASAATVDACNQGAAAAEAASGQAAADAFNSALGVTA